MTLGPKIILAEADLPCQSWQPAVAKADRVDCGRVESRPDL